MREMANVGWAMERRVSEKYAIKVAQSRLECKATAPCCGDCKMDERYFWYVAVYAEANETRQRTIGNEGYW